MPELSLNEWLLVASGIALALIVCAVIVAFICSSAFKNSIAQSQSELVGRLAQMSQYSSLEQSKLSQAIAEQRVSLLNMIDEKLLKITQNVNEGLKQSGAKTDESLTALRERLIMIDAAQKKISALSEQVVSLKEILSNKQARGAFGEVQLHDLVVSVLPPSAYEFQCVLSNQKRADCVLKLPNPPGVIVIDSKFPLESYQALQNASTDRERLEAERFFRQSVTKHIKDIAEKYIIPGETAESALMFLPAESVYAELYANFTDVVETSYRNRVWIVSPTTMMATLNTVRAVLKDAKMREQAGIIQKELGLLLEDVARLDERVENLAKHFEQSTRDIGEIKISSNKIARKINRIEEIEMGAEDLSAAIEEKKETKIA
ncbi:MAG: DNA recombination protein RmuC [Alphaproteobacteria bacterium]|nr:DNA recombination protein RmuC [Alphaproteobacteria bacterium]